MNVPSLSGFCVTVTCAILLTLRAIQAELHEGHNAPVAQTESGAVVGKIENLPLGKSAFEYLGIPYAAPPVGELRFAAPKPVKPWSDIRHATEFGASCVQFDTLPFPGMDKTETGGTSEDCLFLNVFVPATIKPNDKMAVMVWIHGGGFAYGTSTVYPAGVLASFNNVIVVSINYRLGVLGFLNIPGTNFKGNYGMLDQVLALKWVQANIASFGGDPNNVTIFGESAGGMSVSLHLISPLSKGLFHRAIMESGAASSPLFCGRVTNTEQVELFAKLINCNLGSNFIECIRGKTAEDILMTQKGLTYPYYKGSQVIVGPTVDGYFLPDLAEILFNKGHFNPDIDVITGVNSNEGALFAMMMPPNLLKDGMEPEVFESAVKNMFLYAREKSKFLEDLILFEYTNHANPDNKIDIRKGFMDALGDSNFLAPALLEARALAKAGRSTYVYIFDHQPVFSLLPDWMGVNHEIEVGFLLGAPFKKTPDPFLAALTSNYSEIEKGLSLHMMKLWTDFAKYGSPNPMDSGSSPVTWPKFTEQDQEYLVLDLNPRVGRRYRANKVTFWNDVVPKVVEFIQSQEKKTGEKASKDEL